MPVPMELSRIIISEINDQQVIYLKEIEGDRTFPDPDRHFRGHEHRPAGEGLSAPAAADARPDRQHRRAPGRRIPGRGDQRVERPHLLRPAAGRHDGELVEIDARPSDAIAVAVTCDPPLPIYVNEDVLNDVLGEQM